MLIVTHPNPNRVDIELSKVIDAELMAEGLDALIEAAATIEDGVIMYTIPSFSMPTGGALAAEMMRLPQLFEAIRHFRRCAVVTDFGWIQTAASIEGALMPGLEIRCFDLADVADAEAWLMDAGESDLGDNMPV